MNRLLSVVSIVLVPLLFCRCSGGSSVAGTKSGSETTNGFVATIVYPNGTPATHAVVRLRARDYLADTASAVGKALMSRDDLLTDESGRFSIDSLDTGAYLIEVTDANGNAVAVPSTVIADSVVDLGRRTLAPTGTIAGTAGGPFVRAFVRIRGLERSFVTRSDGRFSIEVPAGQLYVVNFASSDTTTEIFSPVPIQAAQTQQLNVDFGNFRSDSLAVRAFLDSMGMSGVAVDSVTPDTASRRIRHLDLSRRGLTAISASISDLSFLWGLDVSRNSITDLPSTLDRIPLLAALDLDSTQLSALPSVVTRCVYLQWLFLSGTGIRDLPADMARLTILHELRMQDDSLTIAPPVIFTLRSLKALGLSDNRLTHLPESIGSLDSLKVLSVNGNQLSALPHEVTLLARLETLYAYENNLTTLPDSMGRLVQLSRLEVQTNLLSSIPESMGRCARLSFLHLFDNGLTTLPESITNLTPVDRLSLGWNRLCNLPASIAAWADAYAEPTWLTDQKCP